MTRLAASLALLVPLNFALPSLVCAQDLPAWTQQHGAFAFPDQSGTQLLTTAALADPEAIRMALCTGGRQVGVRFARSQMEGRNSTGRQTPNNFANTAGAVFHVTNAALDSAAACLLAPASLLTGASLEPLTRPANGLRCSKQAYPQFQVDKSRPVVACWPIAGSPAGVQVAMIEFARRLTHALASLVVIDQEKRLYVDYPAEFNGPGADLWRVDDGGEIHPEGFEVVFLLKRGPAYLLGVSWAGAEGQALTFWSAEDGNQFKKIITDSWYRSPL